jgi:hypothetical protein
MATAVAHAPSDTLFTIEDDLQALLKNKELITEDQFEQLEIEFAAKLVPAT